MNGPNTRKNSKLFWLVISSILLYIALDAIVQNLPPHYNPITQPESDLAVGSYGFIMTINFLNRGLFSLLFIFAFLKTLDSKGLDRSKFKTGSYLLGIWAIGSILLALFPTDVPPTPVSLHGGIHLIVAIVAFVGGAFGTLFISRGPSLGNLRRIALPLSLFVIICWLVEFGVPFAPHLNSEIGGLTERLFLGSVLLWIAAVSGYLAMKDTI